MLTTVEFSQIPDLALPVALTIGMFDNLHRGHHHLLSRMKNWLGEKGSLVVITFKNHPREILENRPPFTEDLQTRLYNLEEAKVDLAIILNFSEELAKTTFDSFLRKIKAKIPSFSLFLGEGSAFGKNKEGNAINLANFSKNNDFEFTSVPNLMDGSLPISSSRIRQALEKGDLDLAEKLIGRPFSIFLKKLGKAVVSTPHFNLLSLKCRSLFLPSGKYSIEINTPSSKKKAIAILKNEGELQLYYVGKIDLSEPAHINFFSLEVTNFKENPCPIPTSPLVS